MSDDLKKRVLVSGATGQQGGALARNLRDRGHHVRALVRNPESPAARALAERGVELRRGDFDDTSSVRAALDGIDTFFAMSTPYTAGPDVEAVQGKALVVAAKLARVPHLVFSSVGGAHQQTGIPHFESKRRVEEVIEASGLDYTILGPVFFMDNFNGPWFKPGILDGKLALGMPADRKLQQIDVDSIGRFAALVIERGKPFFGRRIDLASDEKTGPESAAALSRALGRKVEYAGFPPSVLRPQNEDFALMYEWFDRVGYSADIAGLRRDYPEVGWATLEQWAARHMR